MARLQAVPNSLQIAMQSTIEATQRLLVETAKREHAKIMNADPRPGGFRRYVDGVEGASEERAKAFGVIQYDYQRLDAVVQFAMETLFDLSPVLSGDYRMAHTLFVGGLAATNLKDWKPGLEVTISNFLPYSRKIELGKMKMRVPGTAEVYARASLVVDRRFGNIAKIGWTFRGIVDGEIDSGRGGHDSDVRFPVLVISER